MSFTACPCCVVVLNQQREQNVSNQNQHEDVPSVVNNSKNSAKSCTVVENGRVVVKPLQTESRETTE